MFWAHLHSNLNCVKRVARNNKGGSWNASANEISNGFDNLTVMLLHGIDIKFKILLIATNEAGSTAASSSISTTPAHWTFPFIYSGPFRRPGGFHSRLCCSSPALAVGRRGTCQGSAVGEIFIGPALDCISRGFSRLVFFKTPGIACP